MLTSRYLVSNRTKIIANDVGFAVEYRPVYQRTISVYKGIDNELEFQILNRDQKPVGLTGFEIKFIAFDENKNLVLEKDGTILIANKGLCSVTIDENSLLNVKQQYLSYNIYLVDTNNEKKLTYTDVHYGNSGTIYVSSQAFPGPRTSYSVTQFQREVVDEPQFISETVTAEPALNGNEALHTAAIYTSGFTGTVTVQATLQNQITGNNTDMWADVATVTFDGTETEPTPVNFNGVFSYLRFQASEDPTGKVSKILVRN